MSVFWGLPDSRLHEDAGETVPPSQRLPLTSNTFLFLISLLTGSHADNPSGSICKIQLHTCKRLGFHFKGSCKKSGNRNKRKAMTEAERDERENTEHTPDLRSTGLQSFALMHKQTCSESLNDLIVNMNSTSLHAPDLQNMLPSNQFIYKHNKALLLFHLGIRHILDVKKLGNIS